MNKGVDFCFKCHREEHKNRKGEAEVYQLNGICFNKAFNTFSTYGSDGVYYIWNKDTKSKFKQSGRFPQPVVAADFSDDGLLYCFAIGYDWAKGAEQMGQQ